LVAVLRGPFDAVDTLPAFPVNDSYEAYQRLFQRVQQKLSQADHLVIVPNGPFLSLPFGLFVLQPPPVIQGLDYTGVSWMAHRYALTLAPSVQSFVNLRSTVQPSRASKTFIGYGDFVPFGNTDALLADLGLPETCRDGVSLVTNAPRLPETAAELRNVSASLRDGDTSSLILGNDFSVTAVEQEDLADYRIVYFATHAILPHSVSCFAEPALLTSRSAGPSDRDDALLTASEILELQMDADLVVLSACNTGGPGEETGGESLSGLARSFFYAGARSLMVTHWQVPDKPTSILMTDSFRRLATQDRSIAEALRDSQAAFVRQYPQLSHPLAWASFTVVGDGGQHVTRGALASLQTSESVSAAQ
jgi:CHAT domain-containing protein